MHQVWLSDPLSILSRIEIITGTSALKTASVESCTSANKTAPLSAGKLAATVAKFMQAASRAVAMLCASITLGSGGFENIIDVFVVSWDSNLAPSSVRNGFNAISFVLLLVFNSNLLNFVQNSSSVNPGGTLSPLFSGNSKLFI